MSARPVRLLSATLLALAALAACKGEKPAPPPKPAAVQAPAAPARTRDQAMAELMALPELKTWSDQIEKRSHGAAHGAVIEDDPNPRIIEGKAYYQLSFVEDRKQDVHRRASFLVAHQGDEILVDDPDNDTVQSLAEWRRNIRKIELKSG
ncbi:hypothetical protein [Massilia sp. Root335]|uniref:hypothetical protein n=1 Tax=Massilia sp. Root335 TaxID=1736517 RepID=UPI0006FD3770|nr:hypothetical protein [Massilia sp. Root335]KQV37107.1 hypothetical protein ASC93_20815 [Massilia sp. Root335]